MSNSTCNYKREKNPKPILPLCGSSSAISQANSSSARSQANDNLNCVNFDLEHRKAFYHTTFEMNHKERLNFLLKASRYSHSMKQIIPNYDPRYLWEQFSCDLHGETYYRFLLYCYQYVMKVDDKLKSSITKEERDELHIDLMIIMQTFFTLEESAITGVFYLNRGFMMWLFQFLKQRDLIDFLKEEIESKRRIVFDYYGIHFRRLFELIMIHRDKLNKSIKQLIDRLDQRMLEGIYLDFMTTDKYSIFAEQKAIVPMERNIYKYQKELNHQQVDPLTMSNTAIFATSRVLLEREGISMDEVIKGFLTR